MSDQKLDRDAERLKEYSMCPVCYTEEEVPKPEPGIAPTPLGSEVTVNCKNCKLSWKVLVGAKFNI